MFLAYRGAFGVADNAKEGFRSHEYSKIVAGGGRKAALTTAIASTISGQPFLHSVCSY